MSVLIDTNVLMRIANADDPAATTAETAASNLRDDGESLFIVPQVLYEFWTAATKTTAANGLGMRTGEAADHIERFRQLFALLDDTPAVFAEWFALVRDHAVAGTNAYDARLAAAMRAHEVDRLLTFNARDFRKFGVTVVEPGDFGEAETVDAI